MKGGVWRVGLHEGRGMEGGVAWGGIGCTSILTHKSHQKKSDINTNELSVHIKSSCLNRSQSFSSILLIVVPT